MMSHKLNRIIMVNNNDKKEEEVVLQEIRIDNRLSNKNSICVSS